MVQRVYEQTGLRQNEFARAGRLQQSSAAHPWPVLLFIVTAFLPWIFNLGTIALSPYRVILLITVVPSLVAWLSGRAGRIRTCDLLLLSYCLWCSVSLGVLHGPQTGLVTGGILFVETMGPYLLARVYIRSFADLRYVLMFMFRILFVIFILACIETVMNRNVVLEAASSILPIPPIVNIEPRWGLRRVQSVFDHPILYGVTCGSTLAMVHLVLGYNQPTFRRWMQTSVVTLAAFLSLSAGPLTAVIAQLMLISWNYVLRSTRARWQILWALVALSYITVSLLSNQSVPEFFITHFSFDQESANYRVLIWTFGSESVLNHPLWGVGLDRWDRPDWMPPSIDMFWLIHAVFYGLPGGFLMLAAFFSSLFTVVRTKPTDEADRYCKFAYIVTMTGYFLVGWTVHFWNQTYVLFMFMMGACIWLADRQESLSSVVNGGSRRMSLGDRSLAAEAPGRAPVVGAGIKRQSLQDRRRAGQRELRADERGPARRRT